jgi:hypothetical protein
MPLKPCLKPTTATWNSSGCICEKLETFRKFRRRLGSASLSLYSYKRICRPHRNTPSTIIEPFGPVIVPTFESVPWSLSISPIATHQSHHCVFNSSIVYNDLERAYSISEPGVVGRELKMGPRYRFEYRPLCAHAGPLMKLQQVCDKTYKLFQVCHRFRRNYSSFELHAGSSCITMADSGLVIKSHLGQTLQYYYLVSIV